MVLKINGRECPLNFGIGFIRELDKKYYVQAQSGNKFGNGLETRVPYLLTGDVIALAEFIYMGTARMETGRPSEQDVDEYIDTVDDIEKLFDTVVDELKKSNACKMKVQDLLKSLEEVEKSLKAAKNLNKK